MIDHLAPSKHIWEIRATGGKFTYAFGGCKVMNHRAPSCYRSEVRILKAM